MRRRGRRAALAELLQMRVLQGPFDLGGERERELQLLWGCALPYGLADLQVGDVGVQEDLQ